jgi:hypothetical protein
VSASQKAPENDQLISIAPRPAQPTTIASRPAIPAMNARRKLGMVDPERSITPMLYLM